MPEPMSPAWRTRASGPPPTCATSRASRCSSSSANHPEATGPGSPRRGPLDQFDHGYVGVYFSYGDGGPFVDVRFSCPRSRPSTDGCGPMRAPRWYCSGSGKATELGSTATCWPTRR
jgi:hypothetical protein